LTSASPIPRPVLLRVVLNWLCLTMSKIVGSDSGAMP
jgi:hypothetical protein